MPAWQTAKSWIIRSIFGFICGAIMYASQVTPEQATSNLSAWATFLGMSNLPSWMQSRAVDSWVFLSALIALVAYASVMLFRHYNKQPGISLQDLMYPKPTWREKIFGFPKSNEGQLIPLKVAATRLYEAARQGRVPMAGAETLSGGTWPDIRPGSPEQVLNWGAMRIAGSDIALYGRRPPSNLLERIPSSDRKNFIFKDGASILHHPDNDDSYYCDLSVKQKEFEEHYGIQIGLCRS